MTNKVLWTMQNWKVMHAHTERISAVTNEEAENMGVKVYKSGKTKGKFDNYKYMVNSTPDNRTVIMFLDNSNAYNSIVSVLIISLIIYRIEYGRNIHINTGLSRSFVFAILSVLVSKSVFVKQIP